MGGCKVLALTSNLLKSSWDHFNPSYSKPKWNLSYNVQTLYLFLKLSRTVLVYQLFCPCNFTISTIFQCVFYQNVVLLVLKFGSSVNKYFPISYISRIPRFFLNLYINFDAFPNFCNPRLRLQWQLFPL